MISSSSYKLAMDVPEAVREISDCAGTQFDPVVVRRFTELARAEWSIAADAEESILSVPLERTDLELASRI